MCTTSALQLRHRLRFDQCSKKEPQNQIEYSTVDARVIKLYYVRINSKYTNKKLTDSPVFINSMLINLVRKTVQRSFKTGTSVTGFDEGFLIDFDDLS